MSKFIIFLALLAAIHFIFEAIIAPSLRMVLRNKLFKLRDEIRRLKIDGLDKQDEEAFWYIHDGINYFINRLPYLTVQNQANAIVAYKKDPALRERVDARMKMMEQCNNKQLKAVFSKTTLVVEEAFLANMGGWFFYILPIAMVLAAIGTLKRIASSIILAPTRDTDRLFSHA